MIKLLGDNTKEHATNSPGAKRLGYGFAKRQGVKKDETKRLWERF